MSFLEPARLWLLLGAIGLLAVYFALQLRRRQYAVKFTNMDLLASVAPKRPGWRRHLPAAAYLVALAALIFGFAQPARDERVPKERATIIMAIDTSLSMDATDVAPTRLAAAQEAATDFLDILPEKINVGLVTFDGNASLAVPPTTDREAIATAIANIDLGEGTAIGEAIYAGLDAIDLVPADEEGTPPPAAIVLMSDGTTTMGRDNEGAVAEAATQQVPISTIAFGTDDGFITLEEQPYPIPVPVDRASLETIAEATQGNSYAAASEQQLSSVYTNIGSSIGYTVEQVDITGWFIAGAILLLLTAGGMSLVWFSRLP